MRSEHPFIIWTLRRTGGTNLATHLGVDHHEPFNEDRVFGEITKEWNQTLDKPRLKSSVRSALNGKPSIKHCVETVQDEVTQELVRQTVKLGYQHVFLIRRKPHGRLLSLKFAESFNIWGPKHVLKYSLTDVAKVVAEQYLPIESMIQKEAEDRRTLQCVYDQILSLGVNPAVAVFEDLYDFYNSPVSIALFNRICEHVGVNRPLCNEMVEKILFSGGQGTSNEYKLYRNYKEYLENIGKIGEYFLGGALPTLQVDTSCLPNDAVVEMFKPRHSWRSDLIKVEGLVFHNTSNGSWRLTAGALNLSVIWSLPSPTFADKCDNKAAKASRFVALDVTFENAKKLKLGLSN